MIDALRDRIRAMSGGDGSVPGASALLQGQIAAGAMAFVATIVIARELGSEEFGRYALILAIVVVVAQIFDARTWEAATRFAVQHLSVGDRRGARAAIEMAHFVSLAGGLIALALLAALAASLASGLLGDAELSTALTVYALVAPLAALQLAAGIPFRILDRFRTLAALTALAPALRLAGAVVALALGAELMGVVVALVVAEALAALFLVGLAQRLMAHELGGHVGRDRVVRIAGEARRAWRIILASNAYGTLRLANEQLDVVIVGAVASPAAAGVLKLARTLAQPITMLQRPFGEAIFPKLATASAAGRLPSEWPRIRAATRFAAATLIPLALLLAAVSPWLVPALAGPGFDDAWQALLPLALGVALVGTFFWLQPAALASGLQGRSLSSLALATTVQLALVALLVPPIGIAGAGIAYAVGMAIWIALLAPAVRRRMRSAAGEDPPRFARLRPRRS